MIIKILFFVIFFIQVCYQKENRCPQSMKPQLFCQACLSIIDLLNSNSDIDIFVNNVCDKKFINVQFPVDRMEDGCMAFINAHERLLKKGVDKQKICYNETQACKDVDMSPETIQIIVKEYKQMNKQKTLQEINDLIAQFEKQLEL